MIGILFAALLSLYCPAYCCVLPLLSSIALSFNFSNLRTFLSQILPSVDIWHLFRLISWMSALLSGFFVVSFFSSFSYRYYLFLAFLF